MTLRDFIGKQFISVIQWNEPEDGILAWRYPMRDMEIQNGGQLTVRDSQMAAFVNEGRIADVFGPGLHTLNTRNLPILTDIMNWDKGFRVALQVRRLLLLHAPADRPEVGHGHAHHLPRKGIRRRPSPRLRHLLLPHRRSAKFLHSGQRHPRNLLCRPTWKASSAKPSSRRMTDVFASSDVSFLDMAANQAVFADKISARHEADLRRSRPRARTTSSLKTSRCPTSCRRSWISASASTWPAISHRFTQFQAAESLADRRRQSRRRRRCRRRPRGGYRHGADHDGCYEACHGAVPRRPLQHPSLPQSSAPPAANPSRAPQNSAPTAARPNELSQLRRAHAASGRAQKMRSPVRIAAASTSLTRTTTACASSATQPPSPAPICSITLKEASLADSPPSATAHAATACSSPWTPSCRWSTPSRAGPAAP